MAFTKVTGPGIHTLSNIISHNIDSSGIITATKFVGTVEGPITGDLVTNDWITHEGDTNTRIGFPDNDTVSVETAGEERLRIDNQGRVGINTDSFLSGEMLSIRGGANDSSEFNFHTYADFKGGTDAWEGYTAIFRGAKAANSNNQWTGIGATTAHGWIDFANNSASRITMKSNAVGIGTGNPSDTLHVGKLNSNHGIKLERYGATNPGSSTIQVHSHGALSVTSSNNITHTSGGSQQHVWMQGSNEAMRIDENRSLGIGTDGPDSKLHVHNGAFRVTNTAKTNIVEVSTDGNIEVRRTGGSAYIDFSDNTTNDADCRIQHVSDGFEFSTGGQGSRTTKLNIKSGGEVRIGADAGPAQGSNFAALSMGAPDQDLRKVEIGARRSTRGGDWDNVGIGFKVHESDSHTADPVLKMVLDYDGNLGIGVTSPSTALEVKGDITVYNANNQGDIFFGEHGDVADSKALIRMDQLSSTAGELQFHTENGGTLANKLTIKSDGRVLTSVSGGTGGIGLVGAFMARPDATYNKNSGTEKVTLDHEEFDANGWFDTSNSRYTPLCKGWYQFNFFYQIRTNINAQSIELYMYPYKNGASSGGGPVHGWNTNYGNYAHITFSTMIYMNGSSDYLEMYGNSSRSTEVSVNSRMSGFLVHPVA